ncbi:MAG: PCMD domain-containing protein [Bacteroidales bacterium]|nr:PCMD domain-containing protein [Candidatus Cacconaster equi]
MQLKKHMLVAVTALLASVSLYAQRYENVPFGDFEKWTVRYIKESSLLGGREHPLHMIAPTDTIRGNRIYDYSKTIWSTSNAYAVMMGVVKASSSVIPDKGPAGTCAKIETVFDSCKVAGLVNVKVLVKGAIFWGKTFEPISGVKDSYGFMDWGIPFTRRPNAVLLDYRSFVPNTGKLVSKGNKIIDGYDPESVMFLLQNRKEDSKGNIHVKRVGTAVCHIDKSSGRWVMNFRIPVIYGDARKDPSYREYMDLVTGNQSFYALNSRGKRVPIPEEGWGDASMPVTHAIMYISTGSHESFVGALGNTLWVDNIRLEY